MIQGESGTGKEVVARVIHECSGRSEERFEAINCAAIPENLLESELFGHVKGAFTDAKSDRKGIFEICSKGTLLLDEIGDMPLSLQSKLLRVLEEKEVVPLGASKPIQVSTRVIAATHRDLIEEIDAGNFREDLYFRLSIVPLQIPPLRRRKEDILILANAFVEEFNERFKKTIQLPKNDVAQRLIHYDWPGNIRELRNCIERAVVLSPDSELHLEDLFSHLYQAGREKKVVAAQGTPLDQNLLDSKIFELPLTEAKQAFEKVYIEMLLEKTGGNISEVARICGRYRADIYRLFDKYGIDPNHFRKAESP